jgi:hypothetical protein
MIEKLKATNIELYLLFIDLTKAYDSVPLNKLTFNTRLTEATKSSYKGTSSNIKVGGEPGIAYPHLLGLH